MARPHLISATDENTDLVEFASLSAAHVIRSPIASHPITLNLRPLLAPFKGKGRLFLRVERLPQQATLSAGQRNGDNSWTLASDELDDLAYFVPSHAARDHDLAIRVMAIEAGAATTLKVVEHPISINGHMGAPVEAVALSKAIDESRDPPLRSQLSQMQSLFAVRESELNELRDLLERERGDRAADSAHIRSTLQTKFDRKSEALHVEHQRDLERQHRLLRSEILELTTRLEASQHQLEEDKRLRGDLLNQCAVEAERRGNASYEKQLSSERNRLEQQFQLRITDLRREALANSEEALRSARASWEQEMSRVLLQAQGRWKEEEQRRIMEVSQELQRQGELRLTAEKEKVAKLEALLQEGFTAIADGVPSPVSASDPASLNDELAAATHLLTDRDREVRELRQQLSDQHRRSRREFDTALHDERETWQLQEGARRQKLSSELQRDAGAKISALTFRCQQAETALAQALRAKPDAEPSEGRPAYEPHRLPRAGGTRTILAPEIEQNNSDSSKLVLVKEFMAIVCCVTPLILLYPYWPSLKAYVVGVRANSQVHSEAVPVPKKPSASPAPEVARTATVTHGANVRQGPSVKANVLFGIKRGTQTTVIAKSGKWTQIMISIPSGAAPRGWILSSYLSEN